VTTLVLATAAVLAVVLVVGLVVVLVFLTEIRRLMADTASALEVVDRGTARLGSRLARVQAATAEAAGELPPGHRA
jgi:hypothetical protein